MMKNFQSDLQLHKFYVGVVLFALSFLGIGLERFSGPQATEARKGAYDWLQFGFDQAHSGDNTKEARIDARNVGHLHRLYRVLLPDVADGAPAYLSDVRTPRGTMNLLFLTTKDGRILALDASTGTIVWQHQYGPGSYRINNGYQPVYTTSSPAVDPNRGYVYSYGLDGYVHKYRVGNGEEIKGGGWPELCTTKSFNEKGSSALAIATAKSGVSYLYVTSGGYLGDRGDYQGHITAINLGNGSQHVFNADCSDESVHFVQRPGKPDCSSVQSAIWARPGVVYDAATDRIYAATGNGTFDPKKHDWGDTIFSLNPDGTGRDGNPVDSYTPGNHSYLNAADLDLGSTAPAIIPTPENCTVRNLAVQGGKDMKLRLVNLADLSGKGCPGNVGGEIGRIIDVPQGGMVFTQPAVWVNPRNHSTWVFVATFGGLSGLRLHVDGRGEPSLQVIWKNADEGSSPIVANNVLFCAGSHDMRALDPTTGRLLWHDTTIGGIHWESPIVADGVLYITDESGDLTACGL
ncbi:MAG: PQQ-binding-like beta-propeller repeat protein [Bacteroidetes bacterium]|nr:PQQ-binding-like beta-propeller repeat protein [Bacteroidota bacterium]